MKHRKSRLVGQGATWEQLPSLYQKLQLKEKELWADFANSTHSKLSLPSTIEEKTTSFQQLLIIQTIRPDCLHTAMQNFVKRALGINELKPPSLNLKSLFTNDSTSNVPILIIASYGDDPSKELDHLAESVVTSDRYVQIAMGQGQMERATDLLRECAAVGKWLCIKNLHLAISWIPQLERELKALKLHDSFRLWITTEPNAEYPAMFLQNCLKVTYESPPGLKKNVLRIYDTFEDAYISKGNVQWARGLFALSWFHAVCQERRSYIPQGWNCFYEFTYSDFRVALDVMDKSFYRREARPQLEFIRGIIETCVYGGRIDNAFDVRVMQAYLKEFFNPELINGHNRGECFFSPELTLPSSNLIKDYVDAVKVVNDDNLPKLLGLPANMKRSWEQTEGLKIIEKLQDVSPFDYCPSDFDITEWTNVLMPVLTVWKKLNQSSTLHHAKLQQLVNQPDSSAVANFVRTERNYAVKLVQLIHSDLSVINKVLRGSAKFERASMDLAVSLFRQKTPSAWHKEWQGPENLTAYMYAVMQRAKAVNQLSMKSGAHLLLNETVNLSELFHPGAFLNSLRQETARKKSVAIDVLKFSVSWKDETSSDIWVRINGIQIEGALFDGTALRETSSNFPPVANVPTCFAAWIQEEQPSSQQAERALMVPLYANSRRQQLITTFELPVENSLNKWHILNVAMFLK
ncbi:unnamed protein product [Soboliphyme baturini]|uniref:Dynein_heavy domain-containing protein n=1 Tax=Soboliphyme baturini TaxID=241478 RepID=A0A183IHJ4_9BILA|nr:unnamed protein product [Soboliphyme baturini]